MNACDALWCRLCEIDQEVEMYELEMTAFEFYAQFGKYGIGFP